MPANSGPTENSQRIHLVCECGKKLAARATQSGKRLKCPSCGQAVVVPAVQAGVVPTAVQATSAPHPEGPKRRFTRVVLMLMLWSLPVAAAVGGWAYLRFDANRRQQARIDAAKTDVRETAKEAQGRTKQGTAKAGKEDVDHRLPKAIAAKDVSEKANADAVPEIGRTRRAESAADSLLDAAKTKLDAKAIPEAVALLKRYVADPHATKKPEATQLLADCELATSDSAAIKTLVHLSNEQFDQFSKSGKLEGRQIAHPILAEMCATTLRRNLETATQRRKVPEAVRQQRKREAERSAEFRHKRELERADPQEQLARERDRQEREAQIAKENARQTEQDGADRLEMAQAYFQDAKKATGQPAEFDWTHGVTQLGIVLERYPNTKAAEQAKQLLDSLKKDPNSKVAEQAKRILDELKDPNQIAQQIHALKTYRMPGSRSKQAYRRREQAIDKLQAVGKAAAPAVPAIVEALNDRDKYVKRKAIEILGEIGGMQGIVAIGRLLMRRDSDNDPEIVKAAEDSLLKLLPAVGKRLTMGEAIFLWEVFRVGNKRVSPAIDRAWAAAGITHAAIATVVYRQALISQAKARAEAEAQEIAKLIRKQEAYAEAHPRYRCCVHWSDGTTSWHNATGTPSDYVGRTTFQDGGGHGMAVTTTTTQGGRFVGQSVSTTSYRIVDVDQLSKVKLSDYWQPPRPVVVVPTESDLAAAGVPSPTVLEAEMRWMFRS
jgi:hypothetical protein